MKPKITLLVVLAVIITGFAIYLNSFGNEFVYDDGPLIEKNIFIRDFKYLKDIFRTDIYYFADPDRDNVMGKSNFYRPVLTLSFMTDYFLWGFKPAGYHITNTLLHVLNAVLVYFLIRLITGDARIGAATSLLFVAHPVHVEAVAYISGRADLLATMFLLLSFYFYVKQGRSGTRQYYIYSIAVFAAALLSKELAAILIPLLMLHDLCFAKRPFRPLAVLGRNKRAYLAYIAAVLAYSWVRSVLLHLKNASADHGLRIRLMTTAGIIIDYLKLLVAPLGLHMERIVPINKSVFEPRVISSVILLAGIGFLIYRSRRFKNVLFGSLWFFIALFPFMNIIPLNAYIAEHWLYVPSIGLFLVVGHIVARTLDRKRRVLSGLTLFLLGAFLVFCADLTIRQNRTWKDQTTFDEYTLKHSNSLRIHANLANAYASKGQFQKAISEYKAALEINPEEFQIYTNLGNIYLGTGRLNEAIDSYEKSLSLYPRDSYAHNNLGVAYERMDRPDKAIAEYQKAIGLNPNYADPHSNLADLYFDRGMYLESENEWKEVIKLNPYNKEAAAELDRLKKILSAAGSGQNANAKIEK
jgi:tetratricopeptide (TPR) repeat protein